MPETKSLPQRVRELAAKRVAKWKAQGGVTHWFDIEREIAEDNRTAMLEALQRVTKDAKRGWMDSLHYDYHLGNDIQDLKISQNAESCKKAHPCIDTDGECTAKEVLVIDVAAIASLTSDLKAETQKEGMKCTQSLNTTEPQL